MAEPICEDEGLLQEWAPLTQLLQQIPLKTQRGLFSQNLNLTCLDVVPEFIALGTNLGFVYWYCRTTGDLQRLRFESCHCSVTCTKIMPFADYMVAVGTDKGTVIVFQIPKIEPGSTLDHIKSKQKQIERFTINGLHQTPVTCIEWDPNEMKVFSGDKSGCVVLTEINLNLHISKSMELLNEQFEIVQLSYSEHFLLISTVYRSIICDGSNNWKVHQVGTKERKILGKFGATLCKFQHGLVLYASRPGHRLWLSDKNGVVQQTLIFKSVIQSHCQKIQLINPIDKKQPFDTSFGKIIQFGDNKLITYNSEILYVLHPGAVSVVSVLDSARKILDLAVNENEIFILEGERSLLRIGPVPDKYSLGLLHQPASRRTSFNFDELAAKIKDTAVESIKKITKDLIPTNEQASPNSPPALADEALELPPIVNFPAGLVPTIYTDDNIQIHSIDQNFSSSTNNVNNSCQNHSEKPLLILSNDANNDWQEEIITRPLRKRHNKKPKPNVQGNNLVSESEPDTISDLSEDRLVCGVTNDLSLSDESAFSHSQSSFSVLRDISSLLGQKKTAGHEELLKASDTKSQTSLDTCESVSERLLLSSEAFREEQERTFARLANQPLFDSFNSERTDNMSISLNMTTSSSFSSKVSENLPSPSYTSENSGAASRTKSAESQNTDNLENEMQSLAKGRWKWGGEFAEETSSQEENPEENLPSPSYTSENSGAASSTKSAESQNTDNLENEMQSLAKGRWKWGGEFAEETSSQEENVRGPSESSVSNRNSQQEGLYPSWPREGESSHTDGSCTNVPVKESHSFERPSNGKNPVSGYYKSGFSEPALMNGSSTEYKNPLPGPSECEFGVNEQRFSQLGSFLHNEKPLSRDQEEEDEEEEAEVNQFERKVLLPNETLSYGPPSGSSMMGLQPSCEFSTIPLASQISSYPIVRDSTDHWPQYKTPEKITSLAASKNYVVCTDTKDRVYFSRLSGLGLSWTLLDYKASMVRTSSDGSSVRLLKNKKAFALINPSPNSPMSDTIVEIASDIKTLAIDNINNDTLMVTLSGKIISYNDQLKDVKVREVPCDHVIADLACSGGVILAVSNEHIVLCKLPEEEQFRIVKTLKPVTSVALGPENLLWVVDRLNNIYFCDDCVSEEPHWWQIQISDYIFRNSSRPFQNICNKIKLNELKARKKIKNSQIATNESSVWIFNKFDSCVYVNKTGFTGYMSNEVSSMKLSSSVEWQTLCAGGDKGRLWLSSLDGNIFCTTLNHQTFQSLPAPCEENILCITASMDTLWVLTESGRIHSRLGLSSSNVSGTSWKELKSSQIDNLRFVWISCGCDVAWACDIHGRTFITIGSPNEIASLDPTWVEVEGRPKDVQFEKVFVASQLYMVWAIDTNHNLYVREGIFPHYQIGTNWVYVCGIEASHVTISGDYVWALAFNGSIYRRCGVSENNFIGDYWRSIPGNFKMISSSFTNELWGISHENKILRLSCNLKILRDKQADSENKEIRPSKEDVSWEIVK